MSTNQTARTRRGGGISIAAMCLLPIASCGSDLTAAANTTTTAATGTTVATATTGTTVDANADLHCTGHGETTVVLLHGVDTSSDHWGSIEAPLSLFARVCSSLPSGTGIGALDSTIDATKAAADDLHALLDAHGEAGPYVIVGSTSDSAQAFAFAARYRDELAGIALLDASPHTWPAGTCNLADNGTEAGAALLTVCQSWSDPNTDDRVDYIAEFDGEGVIHTLASATSAVRDPNQPISLERAELIITELTRLLTSTDTSTTSPPEDPAPDAGLTGILEQHRAAGEFVGARLAIRTADGTITEVVSGTASTDPDSAPVDPDVAWNIGSATKLFVAVVVLQLAEEGRIDLDAGITPFFPELPGADRITPRQLLQHTSGLNEYIDQPAVLNALDRPWTPAELITVAEAAGRVGEPGSTHHYANTNYLVLGEIIRQITGHSWSDEVDARIVRPLGLTATGVITTARPIGYTVAADGSFVDATLSTDPSIGGAAGALASTDRDLLRFVGALAGGDLLSAASLTSMQTFVPGEDYSQFRIEHGYGLGLERYITDTLTIEGHLGTGPAQTAYIGWDTATGTAIAVQTNTAVPGTSGIIAVEALTALRADGD